MNDEIELLVDVTWIGWSSFQELRVEYDNPVQSDRVSIQEWNDVVQMSAGLNYAMIDKLLLKTSMAIAE